MPEWMPRDELNRAHNAPRKNHGLDRDSGHRDLDKRHHRLARGLAGIALIASGAVFAADLAKDHLGHARAAYPNFGVSAPADSGAAGGDSLQPAPTVRFRLADDWGVDMTYDTRWRVPEAFGYHPATFDSAEPDPASAGGSRSRDDSPPREGRGASRVQF